MKKLLLLTLAIFAFQSAFSQANRPLRYWEAGGFIGTMSYSGDINGGDLGVTVNEIRPQLGILLKRNTSAKFNINVELAYGKIYASDENHGNPDRGFEVNTDMLWSNLGFDFHFKKFGKYFKRNGSTPYIAASVGALFYSPKLKTGVNFEDYNLYPGTDGTYNIMFAFGWKWRISEHGILGLSFNYHNTGTTHLEGFEAKEGVSSTDSYYGLRLTLSRGFFAN